MIGLRRLVFLQRRSFSTSSIQELSKSVLEETNDIASAARLLKTIRQRANPAYHNVMPMRTPVLWSESLLKSTSLKAKGFAAQVSGGGGDAAAAATVDEDNLTPRSMHDSYSELVLPFSSSEELLEEYINASGGLRTGKLMENLDSLAGSIAYKHMLGPGVQSLGTVEDRGFYIVTASVDRLDMLSPLDPKRDLRLSGLVVYTGRSSMEIVLKMESIGGGLPDNNVMIGRFSMVCRNATTHKARKVNPLVISSTPEERSLYSLGENMKHRRQISATQSLSEVPPSSEEAAKLHSFYLENGKDADPAAIRRRGGGSTTPQKERVWMGDTVVEKFMLMFPQERNVHQKVFGGYLMRLAYELGFSNASMFCRGPIRFLSLDGISFVRPVPIGSILKLESMVLHTSSSEDHPVLVHVGVKATVLNVRTGEELSTNDFRLTWCQEPGRVTSSPLRQVVPKTYTEAMLWLEGRRALELGSQIRHGSREQ